MILLIYFDYYVLIFLVEKFRDLSIQHVNYVAIGSSVLGFLVFTFFFANSRRRVLNFMVSGSILGLSLIMLVASLTLPRGTVEVLGLVSLCRVSTVTGSFPQDLRRLRAGVLLFVQRGAVSVARAGLHDRHDDALLQHRQLGDSVLRAGD